jgi:hypothetical protein
LDPTVDVVALGDRVQDNTGYDSETIQTSFECKEKFRLR